MKPTHASIAVALALAVVTVFFILPDSSIFGIGSPSGAAPEITTNTQIPTTMPTGSPSELQITDVTAGNGAVAAAGDTVTVNYVGSLTDGKVFDASANHGTTGFTFTLGVGQVIQGWDQGIVGMKEGGKRKLVIPAALAYGDRAVGDVIPANSTLVFEVELLKVQKGTK
ncbi:MAG: FKBP-type peptidyl-prolyl cis-trans isomerase [bacterium]|nr:FKBP-type peptidyl-prolyl cis-trans isomerase [bacterium]MDO8742706.1 FKBP-type peptidyl-prolyl cis-trans isomerase [bacterium]